MRRWRRWRHFLPFSFPHSLSPRRRAGGMRVSEGPREVIKAFSPLLLLGWRRWWQFGHSRRGTISRQRVARTKPSLFSFGLRLFAMCDTFNSCTRKLHYILLARSSVARPEKQMFTSQTAGPFFRKRETETFSRQIRGELPHKIRRRGRRTSQRSVPKGTFPLRAAERQKSPLAAAAGNLILMDFSRHFLFPPFPPSAAFAKAHTLVASI